MFRPSHQPGLLINAAGYLQLDQSIDNWPYQSTGPFGKEYNNTYVELDNIACLKLLIYTKKTQWEKNTM